MYIGSNCAFQRVTGNAVLAVDLTVCLENGTPIKPFACLSFASLAFSGPAF